MVSPALVEVLPDEHEIEERLRAALREVRLCKAALRAARLVDTYRRCDQHPPADCFPLPMESQ